MPRFREGFAITKSSVSSAPIIYQRPLRSDYLSYHCHYHYTTHRRNTNAIEKTRLWLGGSVQEISEINRGSR